MTKELKYMVKNLITIQLLRKCGYLCDMQWVSQVALVVKNPPANAGNIRDTGSIAESEDPLEEGMEIHSSILALENSMVRGVWWATVHRITKSWTCQKWLSTHTSDIHFKTGIAIDTTLGHSNFKKVI